MMNAAAVFAADYSEAREKFLAAAAGAGLRVESYAHPLRGPDGGALACDVTRIGPEDATAVMLVLSAMHGAEGFAGSGLQVALLREGVALPPGTAVVHVHALNPWGFAWLRREDDTNVDPLRNLSGHRAPFPSNPAYEEIADAIAPRDWTGAGRAAAEVRLEAFRASRGVEALVRAVKQGQYTHPDGIIHHGTRACWTTSTLLTIAERHLAGARRIAIVDVHTGFGPYAEGIVICPDGERSAACERLTAWFGERPFVTGDDPLIPRHHVTPYAVIAERFATAELTGVGLEYGTYPPSKDFELMRADNWLHHHGDLGSALGREIKARVRRHNYPDLDDWKSAVTLRGRQVAERMLAGIAA